MSRRDPFWDNARWATIALVVVGHVIEEGRGDPVVGAAYLFLYAFHMPLFAFISGRFSHASPSRRHLAGTVTGVLVPYLVFSVVWGAVRSVVEGDGARLDLSDPYWVMWFLLALLLWRAVLPLLAVLRHPVLLSVAASVGAAYMSGVGAEYDGARVLGLLPFFVLGWASRERGWRVPDPTPAARTLAVAVLVAGAVAAHVLPDLLRAERAWAWTHYDENFVDLGAPQWWAGGVRLLLMAAAAALAASFLVLLPRGPTRATPWGRATLYVYLLHGFPVYLVRRSTELPAGGLPLGVWGLLAPGGVVLAGVLASGPVRRLARPLVEPRVPWLLRPPPDRPPPGVTARGAGGAGR